MREGWEYKKLGEVCQPKSNIERATKCFSSSDRIEYVDISSIDNLTKKIIASTSYSMDEAPSRAQQKVCLGDIIISTVRPNLKNVAKVDKEIDNLVVSSGFCVLRTNNSVVNDYIYHYVSSDLFANHLMKLSTGANYPAVRDKDVRESVIPVPSKSDQLSIVAELDQINDLIRLKKEQLKEYDNLAQSIFYDMFGDPVENEKGWEVKKLGDISTIVTGNTPSRKILDFYNDDFIEWIKSDNIDDSILYPTKAKESLSEKGANKGRIANLGEILVTCIAGSISSIGTSCVLNRSVAFNQQINAITKLNGVDAFFLRSLIKYSKKYFQEYATTGMKHIISKSVFESIKIPLPPLPLQQEFSSRIEQIEKLKTEVQKTITDLETLLASRMQYWFE